MYATVTSARTGGRVCRIQDVVPIYRDSDFRWHFRLRRETFEMLLHQLSFTDIPRPPSCHGGRKPLRLQIQLLITLWIMGTQETIRSVSDRFGISESTVCYIPESCCSVDVIPPKSH